MWTRVRLWAGKLLLTLGIPGIIVNQTYDAAVTH